MRTIAGFPAAATSGMACTEAAKSIEPCCVSSTTASKSSRARVAAMDGSGRPHQAVRRGVPPFRRSGKDGCVGMAPFRLMMSSDVEGVLGEPSPARLDLLDRTPGQLGQLGLKFGIAHRLAGAVEVLADLAQDVRIARFLEIGQDHALGIGFGLTPGLAQPLGNPE